MNPEEMDQCWKKLAESMEEEVRDKYKVEDSKREAHRGRGNPLEWRLVRRSKRHRIRKWREDCWALCREYNLQRRASTKQAGGVGGRRRDEEAAKNKDYETSDIENQIKRKNGR